MSVDTIASNSTIPFDETPVQAGAILPISFGFMGVAIVAVSLRLYCRYFLTKKVWWDDGIIVLALLTSIGLTIDSYYAVQWGWGHHSSDIPATTSTLTAIEKTLFASELFLTNAAALTKCSILFFYLRITSGGAHRTLYYATIVSLVLIAACAVGTTIAICVQCLPISDLWDIFLYAERAAACKPYSATLNFFLAQGITNTIGDFVVVLLPAKQILSLNLPKRQKYVVVVLFFLGLLASIVGILRMCFIANSFTTPDNTWDGAITFCMGDLEVNTGVICASVPAIKPLVVSFFPDYNARKSSANAALTFPNKFSSNGESTLVEISQQHSKEVENVNITEVEHV